MNRPRTRFASFGDDRIAYQVVGDGPVDLVMTLGSAGHIDAMWENPMFADPYWKLAEFTRLILFDARGSGSSDPLSSGGALTWESWVEDLGAVMDAVGCERVALVGTLDASAASILFAAMRPERIRALILINATARYRDAPDYPAGFSPDQVDALTELLARLWGTPECAAYVYPSRAGDVEFAEWYARYLRGAASPKVFAEHFAHVVALDVRSALATVAVPTLVLHRRDNLVVPLAQGRYVAEHIEGARFVELPGGSTVGGLGVGQMVDEIRAFLIGGVPTRPAQRVLATVLFSDVVDSTGRAAALGDRRWAELLGRHYLASRRVVEEFRGRMVNSTGDGVLAIFDAPTRAVRAAFALGEALADVGLPIRAGLHTGEVEVRDDDIRGIGVHIAARVVREAGAGEVLVTRTVRDLATGADLEFHSRGATALKGVPDEWELFAVQQC